MGESSAFLTRSLSHPSPKSSESREKDPIHGALTSSVSLGRFMSETLAWDKWSVFNQNRYIEEAERYSKPGSVAAKKAYFEAHYKNLAAKKAAALLELQCPAVDSVSSEHKMNGNDNTFAAKMDPAQERGECTKITEIQGVNALLSVDASRKNMLAEGSLTEEAAVATEQPPFTEKNVKPLSNQQMDVEAKEATAVENISLENRTNENDDKSSSQIEPAQESTKIPKMHGENTLRQPPFTEIDVKPSSSHQMDVDTRDEQHMKKLLESASAFGDSASIDRNEDAFSSGKPSSNDSGSNSRSSIRPNARVSRRKLDHTQTSISKKRSNQSLEKKSARGHPPSTDKVIKPLSNHHRGVETRVDQGGKAAVENPSASGASVTSDKNEDARSSRKQSSNNHGSKSISSIKPNIPTCTRKLDHTDNPISKKRPTQSLEKKRPAVHALHKSMNFTSRAFDASKTLSPVSKKTVDSRLHKPIVRTSAVSSSQQTLLRASVGGMSHLRVAPELKNGRTKTLRDPPVSGSISGSNNKSKSSLQDGKPKPACQSKVKPTTSLQSFCLRSDERAAKRKEFFEKLEQQKLISEAEKELCKSKQKEKAKCRSNVLHQSVPYFVEVKENSRSSTNSSSIATQKLPTQSYFQQIKRRLASEARDNSFRPPWRFSKKTDSFGVVAEKNCKVAVTPMKTKSENTCPNIQLSTHNLAPKTILFARD